VHLPLVPILKGIRGWPEEEGWSTSGGSGTGRYSS